MLKKFFLLFIIPLIRENLLSAELIFDYGIGKGDIELSKTDIDFKKYEFGFKFPYLNIHYDSFFMSQFGYIGFKSPDFYINIYRSMITNKFGNGSIFYQSYLNRPFELENMKELIQAKFGDRYGVRFIPTNAFVITWFNIRSLDQAINSTVSFQIISISDDFRSFVIFSYGDLGFPCSEINLRHTTNYESLESYLASNNFDSINQFSNVNQSGVFIFEVNANFVCDKAEIYQDQNLYCTLLSNQSEIFKLEIKFCEINYTHESNGTGLGVEKFYFVFKCPIEGSIELQIVEVDSKSFLDKILYRRKINVLKTFATTIPTMTKKEEISTAFLQKAPVKENWFFLSNKIDNKNIVQGYFETWKNDSKYSKLMRPLKEITSFDLMHCLSSCHQLNECKIINFENEKCIIFSQ